jgi:predicted RecA/RadA family phage recombinase
MKNYVQPGRTLSLVAPYDVASGAAFLVGGIFAVASAAALSGETAEGAREGVFDLAKVSAQAWSQGDPIYWDNTAKLCTNVPGDLLRVGYAVDAAANPTSAGRVVLAPSSLVGPVAPSAAIADLVAISGGESPTEAEHNAVITKVNGILAALRAKNVIAD